MRYIFLVIMFTLGFVISPAKPAHAQAYVSHRCWGYSEAVDFYGWYTWGQYADVYDYGAQPFPGSPDYVQGQSWPQSTMEITGYYPTGAQWWIAGTLDHYGNWSCYEYHY